VCEQAQIGMSSGANTHLTMGAHESGVADFHKILADHMGAFDHQEPAHLKPVAAAAAGNRATEL
jgi:hypothetical protein